jgi:hypothetical protein
VITPQGAITAGAKWSIDGGKTWNDPVKGLNLPLGSYTVQFSNIPNWDTPASVTVDLKKNGTAPVQGNYKQGTGSVVVSIAPQGALSAGGQWRVDGGAWQNSGVVVPNLIVGAPHTVECKPVTGWTTPANPSVTVQKGQTATASCNYIKQVGSVAVSITPQGAISGGAQWRVDGGAWQNGGASVPNLSVGRHIVEFKDIACWEEPDDQGISIEANKTTKVQGTYKDDSKTDVKVVIATSGAISAGAQWRIDAGKWQNSGSTANVVAPGTHTIEFKVVTGYKAMREIHVPLDCEMSNVTITMEYDKL